MRTAGGRLEAAHRAAVDELNAFFACDRPGLDLIAADPADPTRVGFAEGFSARTRAGLLLAGLSEQARLMSLRQGLTPGGRLSTDSLVDALARDAADGVLDGIADEAPLGLRSQALGADTLRGAEAGLVAAMASFLASERNATGLRAADLDDWLHCLAVHHGPPFAAGSAPPASPAPAVRLSLHADTGAEVASPVAGCVTLRAHSLSGVPLVHVSARLDGREYAFALERPPAQRADLRLCTEELPDGALDVQVTHVDRLGRTGVEMLGLAVDNLALELSVRAASYWVKSDSLPRLCVDASKPLAGMVVDDGTATAAVSVAGASEPVAVPLPVACGERRQLYVYAWDAAGNTTPRQRVEVAHDCQKPRLVAKRSDYIPEDDGYEVDYSRADGSLQLRPRAEVEPYAFEVGQADIVTFHKFAHRLDCLPQAGACENVPTLRLSATDTDKQTLGSAPAELLVEYTYRLEGAEGVDGPWQILTRDAEHDSYALPLSYQRLLRPGARNVLQASGPHDTHSVMLRVTDGAGNRGETSFRFHLHVLWPPVRLADCAWHPELLALGAGDVAGLGRMFSMRDLPALEGTLFWDLPLPSGSRLERPSVAVDIAHHGLNTQVRSVVGQRLGGCVAPMSAQRFKWDDGREEVLPCGAPDAHYGVIDFWSHTTRLQTALLGGAAAHDTDAGLQIRGQSWHRITLRVDGARSARVAEAGPLVLQALPDGTPRLTWRRLGGRVTMWNAGRAHLTRPAERHDFVRELRLEQVGFGLHAHGGNAALPVVTDASCARPSFIDVFAH